MPVPCGDFSLHCRIELGGLLKLLIILRTIERVGAEALGAQSGMPVETQTLITVLPLIEYLATTIVAVQTASL